MIDLKKEPRLSLTDVVGGGLIYLAFLFFLIMIHIAKIASIGGIYEMLNTIFIIFLTVYEIAAIFGMAFLIIHVLRYLVWQISTPLWLKDKVKMEKKERLKL